MGRVRPRQRLKQFHAGFDDPTKGFTVVPCGDEQDFREMRKQFFSRNGRLFVFSVLSIIKVIEMFETVVIPWKPAI